MAAWERIREVLWPVGEGPRSPAALWRHWRASNTLAWAVMQHSEGHHSEAEALAREALVAFDALGDPHMCAHASRTLAGAIVQQARWDDAAEAAQGAYVNPDFQVPAGGWVFLADLFLDAGRHDEGGRLAQKGLDACRDEDAPLVWAWSYMMVALAHHWAGDAEAGRWASDMSTRRYREGPPAPPETHEALLRNRASLLVAVGEPEEALEVLSQLTEESPRVRRVRGEALRDLERHAEAKVEMEAAFQGDVSTAIELARLCQTLGQHEERLRWCAAVEGAAPDAYLRTLLARERCDALRELGRYEESLEVNLAAQAQLGEDVAAPSSWLDLPPTIRPQPESPLSARAPLALHDLLHLEVQARHGLDDPEVDAAAERLAQACRNARIRGIDLPDLEVFETCTCHLPEADVGGLEDPMRAVAAP